MKIIEKKLWPQFFEKVLAGEKIYELRLADFECNSGDKLVLKEWDLEIKEYTGRVMEKIVGHVGKIDVSNYRHWTEDEVKKYGYYVISLK